MEETKLYDLDYSKPSGYLELDKYQLPLPKMPPRSEMMNYGLPKEQQKFRRTEIPTSILKYKQNLTEEEDKFIANEWHKRFNGIWVLIKGLPVYITGPYYHFLNYHVKEDGEHPGFRYIQCLIYLFWDMIVRDKNCYGAFLVGPRRVGKTEFTLGMTEEYTTRVRSVHSGMQSKNDTAALENFKRITFSNMSMIWFMKPINRGGENPNEKLEFMYPTGVNTEKKLRELAERGAEQETIYTEKEMGSWIDFQPSIAGAYDRVELNRWIMNEAGKLEKMSLLGCWDKVKPCLHYKAGKQIVGKAWFETTIEEVNDSQIAEVNTLYRDSNPDVRDANGRTTSGLYSLFVAHADAYDEDEWGFPMREEAELFLQNQVIHLQKEKKYNEISNLLRKNPRTIEDALTPSGSQSAFNKERLTEMLQRLDFPEKFGLESKEWTVRGNFVWAGGKHDTRVIFLEHEEGKFVVSQLLKNGEDCASVESGGMKYPLNSHKYRGGCDPYEHANVNDKNRASLGAAVIMRMYDDNEDGAKKDDAGSPYDFAWEWKSKQPVCHYAYREEDPDLFFEDILMMHYYYGCQMNVENNKGAIKKHFRQRGYEQYIMDRPESTYDPKTKGVNLSQTGTPATTDTIDQYFMAIAHYIMVYGNACKHREIIMDLLHLNKANRTSYDLGVSFGWSLIACEKHYYRMPEPVSEEVTDDWFMMQRV
jgi:hypothetical protein